MPTTPSHDVLAAWMRDARRRTLELIADLDDAQLMGPRLAIINPLLWEIGHIAWFQEKWVLRHSAGRSPLRADADALYDSAAVAHDTRWVLPLPSRAETLRYMSGVEAAVLERLTDELRAEDVYFTLLAIFHEDMHAEAFTYTRQTLGYAAPRGHATPHAAGPWRGDVLVDGGTFMLGATPGEAFVFDNEKWAHPVALHPFAIALALLAAAPRDAGFRSG